MLRFNSTVAAKEATSEFTNSEIVSHALNIISLPNNDEFCQLIIGVIYCCRNAGDTYLVISKGIEAMNKLIQSVELRRRVFVSLLTLFPFPSADDFDATIRATLEEWRKVANDLQILVDYRKDRKSRGRRRDPVKMFAAESAYNLLVLVGQRPTLSSNGSFFELASVIYEGATGKANVNLERQCRAARLPAKDC